MSPDEIRQKIKDYQSEGKRIFATSSFQTQSIPMLHILSHLEKPIDICFINTGFHFPETLRFRDKITNEFELNLVDVKSMIPRNQQMDDKNLFYFTSDPDRCCFINKIQPLEPFLMKYDVWITGVRADQNENRKSLDIEQDAPHDTVRFHPMLAWTGKMIFDYIREHNLPRHPLDNEGYLSIGCEPCTRKIDLRDDRAGRWFGLNKTECGLHTDLVTKQ